MDGWLERHTCTSKKGYGTMEEAQGVKRWARKKMKLDGGIAPSSESTSARFATSTI